MGEKEYTVTALAFSVFQINEDILQQVNTDKTMSSEACACKLSSFNWYSAKAEWTGKIRTCYLKETINYWITFP